MVCGRVADASVTVGAAMWWHGWTREKNVQEVASALMVGEYCIFVLVLCFASLIGSRLLGHVIECSTYATGGYYSGFKDLGVNDTDMGMILRSEQFSVLHSLIANF